MLHSPWQAEVDDAALTGNEGTDADVTRALATDEELLFEEEAGELVDNRVSETLKLLASGGAAGAVSKTCTAPLARLTILYQVGLRPANCCSISCVSVGRRAGGAAAAQRPPLLRPIQPRLLPYLPRIFVNRRSRG
jgi:hypothetical protein